MATITHTPTVSRSRADRSSAGVVAGYIRELAGEPVQPQRQVQNLAFGTRGAVRAGAPAATAAATTAAAATDALGAGSYLSAARGRSTQAATRHSARLGRGDRGACSMRAKRTLESL